MVEGFGSGELADERDYGSIPGCGGVPSFAELQEGSGVSVVRTKCTVTVSWQIIIMRTGNNGVKDLQCVNRAIPC